MESLAADGEAVWTEVPGWEANASGYVLGMEAEVMRRRRQDMHPPRLIFNFCLQTISSSTGAAERAGYFTIDQPYQNIICDAAWNEETQWMLSRVAADRVRPVDLARLVLAFRRYTRAVLDRFPIMELSAMEFFSVIEIPPAAPSSTSTGHLLYIVPPETQRYFFEDDQVEEEEDDVELIGEARPAAVAAVERLRTKNAERAELCSICLDEFDVMTRVLEMPCRHIFHDECLREWLARSDTCPLCRFTLSQAGTVATES